MLEGSRYNEIDIVSLQFRLTFLGITVRKRVKLVSLQFVSWISDSIVFKFQMFRPQIVNKTRTTE